MSSAGHLHAAATDGKNALFLLRIERPPVAAASQALYCFAQNCPCLKNCAKLSKTQMHHQKEEARLQDSCAAALQPPEVQHLGGAAHRHVDSAAVAVHEGASPARPCVQCKVEKTSARDGGQIGTPGRGDGARETGTHGLQGEDDGTRASEISCAGSKMGLADGGVGGGVDGRAERETAALCCSRWWMAGLVCIGVGNGLDFVSLGITKQSVVTLVGSWSMIANTVLAAYVLGERTSRLDYVSAGIIVAGIAITVVANRTEEGTQWTVERIMARWGDPLCAAMLACLLVLVVGIAITLRVDYTRRLRVQVQAGSMLTKPVKVLRVLYVLLGALVAVFTVLLGKLASELIMLSLGGNNQFTGVLSVFLASLFVLSLPLQLFLINLSLSVNTALLHVPAFYVFWNLGSILTGAVFYQEMDTFAPAQWVAFVVGFCILTFGVLLINKSEAQRAQNSSTVVPLPTPERDQAPRLETCDSAGDEERSPRAAGGMSWPAPRAEAEDQKAFDARDAEPEGGGVHKEGGVRGQSAGESGWEMQ